MTTVIVSPHLDDAALSIPAWLATAGSRERVVVLTAFSEGDAVYPIRRAEDRAALAKLGVEAQHLGLRDAPERRRHAPSFRSLILAADDDTDDVEAVHAGLLAAIAALAPDTVLLPLGVGEHIDHRIVHATHARLAGRVGFYEDRPYALVQHAVGARLARLGAGPGPSPAERTAYLASACAAPYVRTFLVPAEREACLEALVAKWTAPSGAWLSLRCEPHRFTDSAVLQRANAAVRTYASQLAALFGDEAAIDGLFESRPYVERIHWREHRPAGTRAP